MPNDQTPLNQTPPAPADASFPSVTDLPPLSDAASPIENQPGLNAAQGAGGPPPVIPPVVVSPPPKRKLPPGKLIAGILGILLLIGGVGAGILLVRQQQILHEKASTPTSCSGNTRSECENVNGCHFTATGGTCTGSTSQSCSPLNESSCRSTSGCTFNPGSAGGCTGSTSQSCAPLGQSACNSTSGCTYHPASAARCNGGGFCSTHTNQQGCEDSQFNCTWQPAVTASCTGEWNPSGFCGTHTNQQGCQDSQYNCTWNETGSCSGTPTGTAPGRTQPPGATAPPAATTPPGVSSCHYTNDGTTVSAVGCSGYTFRALVYTCSGHLVDGRCSDNIVQDTANATSVSIAPDPSCGSKQADLIVTSRPAGDTLTGDELPGTPRVANFVTRDSASTCSVAPPPPTAGAAPSCQGVEAVPSGGPNEKWFQVNPTQGSSPISRVRLYYRLTPSNPNSCGAPGTTPGGWTETIERNTTLHTFMVNTTGLAAGTYQVAANVFDTAGRTCSGNPGCTGADGTSCSNCNGFPGVSCHNCASTFTITGSGGTGATAICGGVVAYTLNDTNFTTPLTSAQLTALHAGDRVKLTVKGSRTGNGRFTQAEFKVNNVSIGTTTTETPGSGSSSNINGGVIQTFWKEYTIPSTTTSFSIRASLTHSVLGTVGL